MEAQPYQWLVKDAIWKPVTVLLQAANVSGVMLVSNNYQRVRAVRSTHSVASSSGTLQIEVLTSGQNADAGVDQLTGTISLAGTADTPITGTVITEPTLISPGDMLGFVLGGTLTSLVNCNVTVYLEQLQKGIV